MVTTVSPAITKTSHPLHTGSRGSGGGICASLIGAGAKASGASCSVAGASALTTGCGSNCGLSEDDKMTSL